MPCAVCYQGVDERDGCRGIRLLRASGPVCDRLDSSSVTFHQCHDDDNCIAVSNACHVPWSQHSGGSS